MSTRIRYWDQDWNLVYDSTTNPLPPTQFLRQHVKGGAANMTADFPDGKRWNGRVEVTPDGMEYVQEVEYLRHIMTWVNPFARTKSPLPEDLTDRLMAALRVHDDTPRSAYGYRPLELTPGRWGSTCDRVEAS